jgi:hypothetical protein
MAARGRVAASGLTSWLLVNPNFARLWLGQAVSQVGDFVFDTTLVLWVGAVLLPGNRYAPAAGRVMSVLVAGWLASTVLAGFSADVAGLRFGRIDTIFLASGLLVMAAGVYAAVSLRAAGRPA